MLGSVSGYSGFCSSLDLVSMVIFAIFDHSFAMLVML